MTSKLPEKSNASALRRFSFAQSLLLLLGTFYGILPVSNLLGSSPKPTFRWGSLATCWTLSSAFLFQVLYSATVPLASAWTCLVISPTSFGNGMVQTARLSSRATKVELYLLSNSLVPKHVFQFLICPGYVLSATPAVGSSSFQFKLHTFLGQALTKEAS
jgi:hypothetical protein